jgi:hypothetical protein
VKLYEMRSAQEDFKRRSHARTARMRNLVDMFQQNDISAKVREFFQKEPEGVARQAVESFRHLDRLDVRDIKAMERGLCKLMRSAAMNRLGQNENLPK